MLCGGDDVMLLIFIEFWWELRIAYKYYCQIAFFKFLLFFFFNFNIFGIVTLFITYDFIVLKQVRILSMVFPYVSSIIFGIMIYACNNAFGCKI